MAERRGQESGFSREGEGENRENRKGFDLGLHRDAG